MDIFLRIIGIIVLSTCIIGALCYLNGIERISAIAYALFSMFLVIWITENWI